MRDDFQTLFGWVGDLLRTKPPVFEPGSREQAIVDRLREGWGTRDTAGLLRELTAEHGALAARTAGRFLEIHIRKDWAQLGKEKARPGTEIDDFIHALWDPLPAQGFEFTVEKDAGSARFRVTRCPVRDLAQRTGLHEWCHALACATDFVSTPAFSDRIEFSRTRTLMQGDDCCDHTYRCRPPGGAR